MTEEKAKEGFSIAESIRKVKDTANETVDKYNEKYLKKTIEFGKDAKDGLKKDANLFVDRIKTNGKKFVKDNRFVKTAEKTVCDGLNAVSKRINLPSKKDMDKLSAAMEALNTKVDRLTEKYSS